MKRVIKTFTMGCVLILFFFSLSSWMISDSKDIQSTDWKAPPSADNIINPLKNSEDAIGGGKKLYKQMCAICHGNTGKGDGMAGMSLSPRPANMITEKTQKQTDGAIYWKITEGRAPMATYKSVLKEEQRWQLVNYIRTLKK